jgi:hypothetical protein
MERNNDAVSRGGLRLVERVTASITDVEAIAVRTLIRLKIGAMNRERGGGDLAGFRHGVIALLGFSVAVGVGRRET